MTQVAEGEFVLKRLEYFRDSRGWTRVRTVLSRIPKGDAATGLRVERHGSLQILHVDAKHVTLEALKNFHLPGNQIELDRWTILIPQRPPPVVSPLPVVRVLLFYATSMQRRRLMREIRTRIRAKGAPFHIQQDR